MDKSPHKIEIIKLCFSRQIWKIAHEKKIMQVSEWLKRKWESITDHRLFQIWAKEKAEP